MIYSVGAMTSSLSVPITFWSHSLPTFRISSICISPDTKKLVTGSYSGQLCLWDFDSEKENLTPKNILISHNHSITCMVTTNDYFVSNCEGGKICRWNLDDGFCSKTNQFQFIHRHMQLCKPLDQNNEWLFACGDYSELYIHHSVTLQVIYVLYSGNEYSWISSFYVTLSQSEGITVSGITVNGIIKVWIVKELKSNSQFEVQSNVIQVENVVDLNCNFNKSVLLIVSTKSWLLINSEFTQCICKAEVFGKERFLGGVLWESKVVVSTNFGKFYIYNISENKPSLMSTVFNDNTIISLFDPTMNIFETLKGTYLVKGDAQGQVTMWKLYNQKNECCSVLSTNLKQKWIPAEQSFFRHFIKHSNVTCCIYVLKLDKFFIGCSDGSIASIPAYQSIFSFYFHFNPQKISPDLFVGHKGKINCLLYPHEKYSHFKESYLVSGGCDFSVCLWDVFNIELLYKFCVQSGEIISLIIPPKDCNPHIKHSICSISSDHSVAILNLKDKRCIILSSRHEFPVVKVLWKPLDDFLIVECFDGTVYVWQMETGHLDRVIDGLAGQEIVYGCNEPSFNISLWNFYFHPHNFLKNSTKREVFHIQENIYNPRKFFELKGFLTSENSESHIFMCDIECLMLQLTSELESNFKILDCAVSPESHVLTDKMFVDFSKMSFAFLKKLKYDSEHFQDKFQAQNNYPINSEVSKGIEEKSENEKNSVCINKAILKMIKFFLASLHFWKLNPHLDEIISDSLHMLKPDIPLLTGIVSCPGVYSLFLKENSSPWKCSSLISTSCVAIIALAKILQSSLISLTESSGKPNFDRINKWQELVSFYEKIFAEPNIMNVSRPKVEIVAKAWQTNCFILRKIVRKLLTRFLQALNYKENAALLDFWYNYLPHFKILDKTLSDKIDFENVDLKTVALVLFGAVGSDLKFKANDSGCQENYVYQTCSSFVFLMLLQNEQKVRFGPLQTIAIDFLGRGYIVWEQFLKMEKIVPILFEVCAAKCENSFHKCDAAKTTLKSIAIARTAAFINCLLNEINKTKLPQNGCTSFQTENVKPIILSILSFLLEKTPYIMMLYLNDVISIFVYCIDATYLKQENLSNFIPAFKKFRQVHHSVTSQRIAVGLVTGSLVLYDLKTGKSRTVSAHKDSISALKFSKDGRFLVSYSCYENRILFWQILSGIFGLGPFNVKCVKSFQTHHIHDEEIRNHLEIASLTWTDKKSVVLSLCDGTESVFNF